MIEKDFQQHGCVWMNEFALQAMDCQSVLEIVQQQHEYCVWKKEKLQFKFNYNGVSWLTLEKPERKSESG